jgi:hypothetical protein
MEAFRNVEPRTREERFAARDKDKLEKARINARSKGRHQELEPDDGNVLSAAKGTALYLDEAERFKRDAAAEEQQRKQQSIQRKQVVL